MNPRRVHGRVSARTAAQGVRLIENIAHLRDIATPANLGAWCAHRHEGNLVHMEIVTVWNDSVTTDRFLVDLLATCGSYGSVFLHNLKVETIPVEGAEMVAPAQTLARQMIESAGGFASHGRRAAPLVHGGRTKAKRGR